MVFEMTYLHIYNGLFPKTDLLPIKIRSFRDRDRVENYFPNSCNVKLGWEGGDE